MYNKDAIHLVSYLPPMPVGGWHLIEFRNRHLLSNFPIFTELVYSLKENRRQKLTPSKCILDSC